MKITLLEDLKEIKRTSPLVLNLTNLVTINDIANVEISMGASPVMSDCLNDALELSAFAKAILINIGTINERQGKIMLAVVKANYNKKPIVLDLVGYGATSSRNEWAKKLIPFVDVLKGNYAEVLSLYQQTNLTKGVDGDIDISEPKEVILSVAKKYNKLILMTGKVDHISDGTDTISLSNGDAMLKNITGTGCMLGAISTVFLANKKSIDSLVNAVSLLNLSAEAAVKENKTPYSFRTTLIDSIYNAINWIDIKNIKFI